ncbi:MAG: sensor histidine kinase, partial [Marinoscillum sp.]
VDGVYVYDGLKLSRLDAINSRTLKLITMGNRLYAFTLSDFFLIDILSRKIVRQIPSPQKGYYRVEQTSLGFDVTFSLTAKSIFLNFDFSEIQHNSSVLDSPLWNYQLALPNGKIVNDQSGTYYESNGYRDLITRDLSAEGLVYNGKEAYIASQGGLYRIRDSPELNIERFFTSDRVECLLLDANQNLWVGTSANGAYLIHRNALNSAFYANNVGGKAFTSWTIFKHQNQLLSPSTNGLLVLDSPSYILPGTEGLFCLTGISISNDRALIGSAKKGVYLLTNDGLKVAYNNPGNALDNIIVQLMPFGENYLACSKHSFIEFDAQGNFLKSIPFADQGITPYIMHMRKLKHGYIAATTTNVSYLDENLRPLKTISSEDAVVYSMTKTIRDTTWAVSLDGGLFFIMKDSLISADFPDHQIFSLGQVNQSIWIESSSAIYDYKNGSAFRYGLDNGFPLKDYSQMGLYIDEDNFIYVNGVGGVFRFHPDSLTPPQKQPGILCFYQNQILGLDAPLKSGLIDQPVSLEIQPIALADQNWFSIEARYAGNTFVISQKTRISLLPDYDASYLELIISDIDGQVISKSSIPVFRERPVWMKAWFVILLFVLSVLAIVGLISGWKFLKTRKALREQQLVNQLSRERLRISRELHDNIGARLTHIISSLDLEMFQRKEQPGTISTINSFARDTMSQLRETIWAMSDKTIFLSELFARIRQYVDQMNSHNGQTICISDTSSSDFELHPTQVINAYRIVQEAINNARKYSKADSIEVLFQADVVHAMVLIKDDGVGFEERARSFGSGVVGMEERAKEAGFELEIRSSPGSGTQIQFTIVPMNHK